MTAPDYPLAKDPEGPYDVTVFQYAKSNGQPAFYLNLDSFRAPWRKLPTLSECVAYIIHPK